MLSGHEKVIKSPEHYEIYRLFFERTKLDPKKCIFIETQQPYIKQLQTYAQEKGFGTIKTILCENHKVHDIEKELARNGIISR